MVTVAKFGGSSLADAAQIRKVVDIIRSDPERTCIVVSAPGKRFPEDRKITDLLYEWYRHYELKLSVKEIRNLVQSRFERIVSELDLSLNVDEEMDTIHYQIAFKGCSADYVASRGEYLNAKILAEVLNYDFVDAAEVILFDKNGELLDDYTARKAIGGRKVVIPGFYGSLPNGQVKTFSRGGSDLTGALMAAAIDASVYENWTDVLGMLMADPRIVEYPKTIAALSYKELRELSYMGASVFHEEAMFPVAAAFVPTNIRNTNSPEHPGTLIVPESSTELAPDVITGVAGRKGFAVLKVDKALMNQEVGFVRRLLTVLENRGISFEHVPSGIDSVSVILDQAALDTDLSGLVQDVAYACRPNFIGVERSLALIAVVGRRMAETPGVAAQVCTAAAEAGVNLRMIVQGSSEINIIIGVNETDFETAIRAIYQAFVGS